MNKDKNKQSIKEEITTQQGLKYEKIVSVKSYSEDDKNVYIILELCKNRSLEDLISLESIYMNLKLETICSN